MYAEDDLLPVSALQHLLYCERQCALIHLERAWAENALTVQGRHLHEKADKGRAEARGGVRVARSVPLRSLELGLWGVADVVEFRPPPPPETGAGPGPAPGAARSPPAGPVPFPVEYKRGRPKSHDADRVQLCAQGLCLEEMLGVAVPAGALFYGKTRRRLDVPFDPPLRELTRAAAARLHALVASGATPPAAYARGKCDRCSLVNQCLPRGVGGRPAAASTYLARSLAHVLAGGGPAASEHEG